MLAYVSRLLKPLPPKEMQSLRQTNLRPKKNKYQTFSFNQETTANFIYKVEGRPASNAKFSGPFFSCSLRPYWSFNLGPRPCHFVIAHWTGSGFVELSRGTVYWMKFTQVLA